MNYLIYVSAAVELFINQQLEELLAISRVNNASRNSTGMLLYHEGNFIQLLEGEAGDINEVYNVIEMDQRQKTSLPWMKENTSAVLFLTGRWAFIMQQRKRWPRSRASLI